MFLLLWRARPPDCSPDGDGTHYMYLRHPGLLAAMSYTMYNLNADFKIPDPPHPPSLLSHLKAPPPPL